MQSIGTQKAGYKTEHDTHKKVQFHRNWCRWLLIEQGSQATSTTF